MPYKVANSIGWPSGNPFQTEIAFANLAFAIMALYISNSGTGIASNIDTDINAYKTIVVGYLSFMGGCLLVHAQELYTHGNMNFNNLIGAPSFSILNLIYGAYLLGNS